MARINFPVPGQCSESCCHRLDISAATCRIWMLGSSPRICLASSRACLRQGMFEPLCCGSPLQLAQEISAHEVWRCCSVAIQACSIDDVLFVRCRDCYSNKVICF